MSFQKLSKLSLEISQLKNGIFPEFWWTIQHITYNNDFLKKFCKVKVMLQKWFLQRLLLRFVISLLRWYLWRGNNQVLIFCWLLPPLARTDATKFQVNMKNYFEYIAKKQLQWKLTAQPQKQILLPNT